MSDISPAFKKLSLSFLSGGQKETHITRSCRKNGCWSISYLAFISLYPRRSEGVHGIHSKFFLSYLHKGYIE